MSLISDLAGIYCRIIDLAYFTALLCSLSVLQRLERVVQLRDCLDGDDRLIFKVISARITQKPPVQYYIGFVIVFGLDGPTDMRKSVLSTFELTVTTEAFPTSCQGFRPTNRHNEAMRLSSAEQRCFQFGH